MPSVPLGVPSSSFAFTALDYRRERIELRRRAGLLPISLPPVLPCNARGR